MDLVPMFLLLTVGMAVSGICGYIIFGPLAYVQARDRKLQVGAHAFAPRFLRWIISGAFRATHDRAITGLATPAQILAWCTILGTLGSGLVLLPFAF